MEPLHPTTRVAGQGHPAKAKPDARPMRLAIGAGGLAAFSALVTGIVLPPRTAPAVAQPQTGTQPSVPTLDPLATPGTIQVQRPVVYVQLSPGESAPPGATVISASAPTPITVVVNVPAPAHQAAAGGGAAPTPVIIKTTQSGQPVP
jgi:hypothetical protein